MNDQDQIDDLDYELFGRDTIYECFIISSRHWYSYCWNDSFIADRYNNLIKLNAMYMKKYTLKDLEALSPNDLDDHFYKIKRLGEDICFYKNELVKRAMPIQKMI